MAYNRGSSALLPTRSKMNPRHPETAQFYDQGQVAYVMRHVDSGALRLFTSFGDLGSAWAMGTVHLVHHDQTLRSAGWFEVVGKRDFRTGEDDVVGEVPDKALAHWVFK